MEIVFTFLGPNSVAVVGEVLNTSTHAYIPSFTAENYIELSGGFNDFADKDRVFVILPNGQAKIVKELFGLGQVYCLKHYSHF